MQRLTLSIRVLEVGGDTEARSQLGKPSPQCLTSSSCKHVRIETGSRPHVSVRASEVHL